MTTNERQKIRWLMARHELTKHEAETLFNEQIHEIKNAVGIAGRQVWLLEDCTVQEPVTGTEIGNVTP